VYDCNNPNWRKIRDEIRVSLIKKTTTPEIMNTSLASGVVSQMKPESEIVCVLNCGDSGIKYQFYKLEDAKATILFELKPDSLKPPYSLSDLNIPNLYPGKLSSEFIISSISRDLEECRYMFNNPTDFPILAIITGDIRNAYYNTSFPNEEISNRQSLFDSTIQSIFSPLQIQPWSGHNSFFISQADQDHYEMIATQNLLSVLNPKLRVLITFGIGHESCQWTHKNLIIGNDSGMNTPDKMMDMSDIVSKKFEDNDYVSVLLDSMSVDITEIPVIALKSGTLKYLGQDKELQSLFGFFVQNVYIE